jgi:hypothetical protein
MLRQRYLAAAALDPRLALGRAVLAGDDPLLAVTKVAVEITSTKRPIAATSAPVGTIMSSAPKINETISPISGASRIIRRRR